MHIYPWQIDPTPSQLSIDDLNTTTPDLADLMADLLADLPPSIEHRCLEYCYTKLGRYTDRPTAIDLWNTITPHKFHIYI